MPLAGFAGLGNTLSGLWANWACGCFNANNVFLEGRKVKYDKYNNKK